MKHPYALMAIAASSAACFSLLAATEALELATANVSTTEQIQADSSNKLSKTITAAELNQQQAQNLADAVRFTPGITVTDLGRFGSSGFNIRGLEGDRVAITIDGLALGETLDPVGSQPYEFFRSGRGGVDIDALKKVEIIKGADAVIAGSGGLAGAVLFVTKDPVDYLPYATDATFVGIKAGFSGANNEVVTGVTVANRQGKLESMLVYSHRDGEEMHTYTNGADITGPKRTINDPLQYKSDNLLAKLQYQLTARQRLGITAEYYEQNSQLNNQSRLDRTYIGRETDDKSQRQRLGLQYDWRLLTALTDNLSASLDYQQNYTQGYTQMLVTNCNTTTSGIGPCLRSEDRDYKQQQLKANISFDKVMSHTGINQQWLYGLAVEQKSVDYSAVDTRYNGQTANIDSVEIDPALVPKTDVRAISIYARDIVNFNQDWTLSFGGRYDNLHYKPSLSSTFTDATNSVVNVDFSAFSWQSNLQYQLTPTQQVWLQTGRGFRQPTVGEMYAPTSLTTRTEVVTNTEVEVWSSAANTDLKAERSLNLELGYRYQQDNIMLGASLFQDRYTNLIDTVYKIQNPGTLYETCSNGQCTQTLGNEYSTVDNIDQAKVRGAEVEVLWQISPTFNSRLAYSINDGDKQNGDPLLSISPASVVIGLGYEYDFLSLYASVRHSAAKKAKDASITAADGSTNLATAYLTDNYTVFDLTANIELNKQWRLNLGLYNAFDTEYYQWQRIRYVRNWVGSGARGGVEAEGLQRYSEPGRYVKLNLSYQF